jgi:predicted membrane-bound dolichyl-phosphate-mannose-protein mannosyltransferase
MPLLTAIVNDKVVQANAVGLLGMTLLEIDTIVKIMGGVALFIYTCIKIYQALNGKRED